MLNTSNLNNYMKYKIYGDADGFTYTGGFLSSTKHV